MPNNYEGWQFSAARCAAGWGYRECAEASGLSTTTITKIERLRMKPVPVSATDYKQKGMVPPATMDALLTAFEKAGFSLKPRTETRRPRVETIK
jgi:hypothetical protein